MQTTPLISVCIPAYKRIHYLERVLDSLVKQSFKDFEVVITDDSNDETLAVLVNKYQLLLPLVYRKNQTQLGTPENWNEGVRHARGQWIKLMHDDDWFETGDALSKFAQAAEKGSDFIFSAYRNCYEEPESVETVRLSAVEKKLLSNNPFNLLAKNLVGPPSVVMYKKSSLSFDKRMKWRVDVDFYVHYLKRAEFVYIEEPLVNVGISKEQVTRSCFLVPEVELPENFLLLEKIGVRELNAWIPYDSWWRLIRNLGIRSVKQIRDAGYSGSIPAVILQMIKQQSNISAALLKVGVFSKALMFSSFLIWRISGKKDSHVVPEA